MRAELSVGVIDLAVHSHAPCAHDEKQVVKLCISFNLHGAFMRAAKTDSLNDTVDYDALATLLTSAFGDAHCGDLKAIAKQASLIIRKFSAQITGGYVSVRNNCHAPFTTEQALL